jgi:hypothetical protein
MGRGLDLRKGASPQVLSGRFSSSRWPCSVVLSPSEKSDTVCKNNLDSLNRRVYTYHIDSAAVARGARTEEGRR